MRTDEDSIVRFLREHHGGRSPFLKMGIGDDAAVFHPRGSEEFWVVTTDLLLEDIDFRREWLTPAQLGHKSLAANLSDLAAMGARPRFYTVALGLPVDLRLTWIDSLFRGMSRLGSRHGAVLIGGDLSRSNQGLHVSITAIGETIHRKLLYRSGGRPGDCIFVTGRLGAAAAGLKLLQQGRTKGRTVAERHALRSQREPQPRCDVGLWLAQGGLASCMMDLSDGLSADLPRIGEACRTGAEVYTDELPVFSGSSAWGCDPKDLALNGGEDFELLFAVPEEHLQAFRSDFPREYPSATLIGRLTKDRGFVCRRSPGSTGVPLLPHGFDHFRGDWGSGVRGQGSGVREK